MISNIINSLFLTIRASALIKLERNLFLCFENYFMPDEEMGTPIRSRNINF